MQAAEREDQRRCKWDNVGAAIELHSQKKRTEAQATEEKHSQDQFLLAAIERPTRFRTRLQKVQYESATARKDAEEEVRSRWLAHPWRNRDEHKYTNGSVSKREASQPSVVRSRETCFNSSGQNKSNSKIRSVVG